MFNHLLFEDDFIADLKYKFRTAEPFPHVVIDNFLNKEMAESLSANFPPMDCLSKAYNGINERKSEGASFDLFSPKFKRLRDQLASDEFQRFLELITDEYGLFVPPDHLGAGLHLGMNGSFLDIHLDANIHLTLNVYRKINLLIYLERDWQEHYHGQLELWNSDMTKCVKRISPEFNRCVIFKSSEYSYHGYSQKLELPDHVKRKSFYTYYYSEEIPADVRYHDTIFQVKPGEAVTKKLMTECKEFLKNNIKRSLRCLGVTWY